MELENEKTEMHHHVCNKWLSFDRSKINKYEDYFFSVLYAIKNPLLPKLVLSRWLDIGLVLFLRFLGPRFLLDP